MACPICSKESDVKYRPFCSRRCADIDLGRWLKEAYTIPVESEEDSRAEIEIGAETPDAAGSKH